MEVKTWLKNTRLLVLRYQNLELNSAREAESEGNEWCKRARGGYIYIYTCTQSEDRYAAIFTVFTVAVCVGRWNWWEQPQRCEERALSSRRVFQKGQNEKELLPCRWESDLFVDMVMPTGLQRNLQVFQAVLLLSGQAGRKQKANSAAQVKKADRLEAVETHLKSGQHLADLQ